jgi:homoserine O-acetyltransferase
VDHPRSTDDARSARPLRHARTWTSSTPLTLESGVRLDEVTHCFETWGELSATADNAILICHAISGDSHVCRHDDEDDPGWWEVLVGPGRPIDPARHFIICANVLGGCRGTTGPNFPRPSDGRPWGADFPLVTVGDMVEAQRPLLDHLGIGRLRAVVGGSLGGLQALEWAIRFPERVGTSIVLAAAPRLSSQGIAFDVVGRNAIRQDPSFAGGQYYGSSGPETGLALARMLAHITYLSDESMRIKFDPDRLEPRSVDNDFESLFSVGSYLAYQGGRFVERFDANSYITLSTAMDLFDLGETPEALRATLAPATCRWLFIGFSTDWLYPPSASRTLVDALVAQGKSVSHCEVQSKAGHDSFLLEEGMAQGGRLVAAAIDDPAPGARTAPIETDEPTSIFYANRLDYPLILRLIPPGASVVDLGCGNGDLLEELRNRGHAPLLGIERDEEEVARCLERGVDVIHANLEGDLPPLADGSFEVAVLSQTLQSLQDVPGTLQELVRIGRRAIVAFPNFAYEPLRRMFMEQGRLPKEEGPYGYEWFDTPNRRFPSILDFLELCERLDIEIAQAIYVESNSGLEVTDDPNRNADLAVLALHAPSRPRCRPGEKHPQIG